jgi:hypothetical protein
VDALHYTERTGTASNGFGWSDQFDAGVVLEEIMGMGAEGVGVEPPSAEGDGDAELMLFVALAVQRLAARRRAGGIS